MDVVIAGGHGKIALLLAQQLTAKGHRVRSLIRNHDHADEVTAAGAEPVIVDLEADATYPVEGADAVVFAAGAGPNSGADRKWTVDRDAALKLGRSATAAGVRRYVMVGAMGSTHAPSSGDPVFDVYLQAKVEADEGVLAMDLDATVIRPGGLTDDPPTGLVDLAEHVERGQVTRADVAAVIAEVLETSAAAGLVVELVGGAVPVAEAVRGLTV